ncbi:Sodium-coupled monocarboxylate transporter 1 [Chionoecetes opilio]|uniref:Sodium-coupled monocarboxylate transporter 1 n=1 Tax=Chionoecetes opilio TaxID=41210 RepID=A0A8J4YVT4_CHIOP|nr:Sodium-coupled monocarboxylate transporter 1 [Chionoecetes opilio]
MVTTTTTGGDVAEATTEDYGDTEALSRVNAMKTVFQPADWVVFSLMLVCTVAIGVVSAVKNRRKATTQDYLLGGKTMSPPAVAISLLGSIVSSISVIGNPTEIYFYGTQITIALLGTVLATIVVTRSPFSICYNLKLVSLNEYLERRYKSVALRKLITLVMLFPLFVNMGMILYPPSIGLTTVTNLSGFASMAIMGAIVTFYITIGGVKAVVYTDVLQTLLMFGGVLVVVVLCCIEFGGVGEVWAIAERGGRIEFFNMDTNPMSATHFGPIHFRILPYHLYPWTHPGRLPTPCFRRTLQISKGLMWFFLPGFWCMWILFFFSGMVAYAVYSTCDPLTSGKIKKADQIIPFLVTDKLGHIPGVSGLFMAAVYGAVLSTFSSMGNSAACVLWEDFLKPLSYFRGLSDSSAIRVIKILSSISGVVAVAMGMLLGNLGSIFHILHGVTTAITGPVCGVFLSGILLPWVEIKGPKPPPHLPLPVADCGALNIANFSTTLDFTILDSPTVSTPSLSMSREGESNEAHGISYCYNGFLCLITTMLGAGLVSLLVGPTCPSDVEGGLVNPTCERLCKRVWHMRHMRRVFRHDGLEGRRGDTADMTMLPKSL